MAEKKNILKKKKLKQIILNKNHFFILKYGFFFEFFREKNHFKTCLGTWLNFWKLSWAINLCIYLTPGVCTVTIEHDCLFFGLSTNPSFFPNKCTQKKARGTTFIKKKTNMSEGKIQKDYLILDLQHELSTFYLTFCYLNGKKKNFWHYGKHKHENTKLVISAFFFFSFELTLKNEEKMKNEPKKKASFENGHQF